MTSYQCECIRRMTVTSVGVLCLLSGIYLYLNWIDMFTEMRGKEMTLSPTSPAYAGWKKSPLPLYLDVYIFNWTNPKHFYVGSKVKPHFQQLGPYRFREDPDKVDIEWNDAEATVSFRKTATFYFDAEGSQGSLDDVITSINTVSHSAALRAKDASFIQKKILQSTLSLSNEDVSVTKTADEWLFKGYYDPLVAMGGFISMFSEDIQVPYDRVGYFYQRNNSALNDGHINMFTGASSIYDMGKINRWNGKNHTLAYEGECGAVKGSMGEFFPPNLRTNQSIYLFLPNFCRAVPLDYTETVQVHGVKAYKFSGTERAVDNGTLLAENKCFCVNGKCELSGVINISPCKFNSSIYMSYPHFYKADPAYLAAVDGLQPNKEQHEFFMTLEPNAGVPMDVGGGFQANYLLEPIEDISPFEDIPRTFMPLMWAEERVRVTPEIAESIALVPLIVLLGQIVTGVLLAVGSILICWYPTKTITKLCHDPKKKSKILTINPLNSITPAYEEKIRAEAVALLNFQQANGVLPKDAASVPENVIIR